MVKCPKCVYFSVVFCVPSGRPTCRHCGWLPEAKPFPSVCFLYKLCDECWGYPELRMKDVCNKCLNEGKVLNSLGKEVVDLIRETISHDR